MPCAGPSKRVPPGADWPRTWPVWAVSVLVMFGGIFLLAYIKTWDDDGGLGMALALAGLAAGGWACASAANLVIDRHQDAKASRKAERDPGT